MTYQEALTQANAMLKQSENNRKKEFLEKVVGALRTAAYLECAEECEVE